MMARCIHAHQAQKMMDPGPRLRDLQASWQCGLCFREFPGCDGLSDPGCGSYEVNVNVH